MSVRCLVSFHAHPDDEAIFTGGIILRAIRAGWRVVVVIATSGEEGAASGWVTGDLGAHRRREAIEAASVLGVDQVVFLGYRDSGAASFAQRAGKRGAPAAAFGPLAETSVLEVAERLHRILVDERADVLTSYDEAGIYGHRDHLRVHEIARAALLGTVCELVEATVPRAELAATREVLLGQGLDPAVWPSEQLERIGAGRHGEVLTLELGPDLPQKMRAVAAHASQVVEAADFMGVPPGAFRRVLAKEHYVPVRTLDGRLGELLSASA
ncbi:MAG TPA: PIG-L family deacetylase [Acidimicrobiales bacterium]|nr:PIG-L family deacetylase [Acidimicrobiales bacterium]